MADHLVELAFQPERFVTVLLVSPFEEDHIFLRRFFERTNWKLHLAHDCQEAAALLRQHRVAVIITERELPAGNWTQVLEAAAHCPTAPKVVVTYRFSEGHSLTALLEGGAYDIVAKPFRESEIHQVVSFAWLQWKRERQAASQTKKKTMSAIGGDRFRSASA